MDNHHLVKLSGRPLTSSRPPTTIRASTQPASWPSLKISAYVTVFTNNSWLLSWCAEEIRPWFALHTPYSLAINVRKRFVRWKQATPCTSSLFFVNSTCTDFRTMQFYTAQTIAYLCSTVVFGSQLRLLYICVHYCCFCHKKDWKFYIFIRCFTALIDTYFCLMTVLEHCNECHNILLYCGFDTQQWLVYKCTTFAFIIVLEYNGLRFSSFMHSYRAKTVMWIFM